MKKFSQITLLALIALLICDCSFAQVEIADTLKTETGSIYGTLLTPNSTTPTPVVLIIAGSGPTDHNGNSPMMTNNSLKMLADSLAAHGIASLRYDKRGVSSSAPAGGLEGNLRFDNYVEDAAAWVTLLKKTNLFNNVIIAGHSEGSLIGMIAAKKSGADAFISIAGAGRSADIILKEQIAKQNPSASAMIDLMVDSLKNGMLLKNVDHSLYILFRPSVQPYLISWFKYNPQAEIAKLTIPVLILQGNRDIQVDTTDAQLLSKACKQSSLKIIPGMNHIFKASDNDIKDNIATYTNPNLPVKKELIDDIIEFIKTK